MYLFRLEWRWRQRHSAKIGEKRSSQLGGSRDDVVQYVIFPRSVIRLENSSHVGRERLPNTGKERAKNLRDGPIDILRPLKQL
jgi:hypothetical protein